MAEEFVLPDNFGDDDNEAGAGGDGPGGAAAPPPPKRRRRHRQNTLLPKRPKKSMNGYTLFLRNYFNTHPREAGVSSHEMLKRASQAWRTMGAHQKQQYQELCAADAERYRREMDLWKKQKAVLKRPPSAYAMFVKDFWTQKKEAGEVNGGVKEMGHLCKQAWDAKSEGDRQQFHLRYKQASEAFKIRRAGIQDGTINIVDLVHAVGVAVPNEVEGGNPEENEAQGVDEVDVEAEGEADADEEEDGDEVQILN